jgi:hypothetical protein
VPAPIHGFIGLRVAVRHRPSHHDHQRFKIFIGEKPGRMNPFAPIKAQQLKTKSPTMRLKCCNAAKRSGTAKRIDEARKATALLRHDETGPKATYA